MPSLPVIPLPSTIQEWLSLTAVFISVLVFLFGTGVINRLHNPFRKNSLNKEQKQIITEKATPDSNTPIQTRSLNPPAIDDLPERGDPPLGTHNSDKIRGKDRKVLWTLERFKAMITAYAAGLWIIVLLTWKSNTHNHYDYFAPPIWLLIILLGFLLVGLIIAFVSHIHRLNVGVYLGILYPLSLPISYLTIQARGGVVYPWEEVYKWENIYYLEPVKYWLIPVAILTTVFLWQTRKRLDEINSKNRFHLV